MNFDLVPDWDSFTTASVKEIPTRTSKGLYIVLFDYDLFFKDRRGNWDEAQGILESFLNNKEINPLAFLLNLFKTVWVQQEEEFYQDSENWDAKHKKFHEERFEVFVMWTKHHFECLIKDYQRWKKVGETKFTAFQWAIIFHYDFIYNNQSESNIKKDAIKLFIDKYKATTTSNSISNDETIIKNSIKDDLIDTQKLESVKLFIKDNFEEHVFDAIQEDILKVNDAKSRK